MNVRQMWARSLLVATLLLVDACSPAAAPSQATTPSVIPTATPSASRLPTAEPASAEPSGSATSGTAGKFTLCPNATQTPTCPLQPGPYTVAVHDRFSLSVPDAGWQEERAEAGEFDTNVVLSRMDEPRQRLTFLSGPTGPTSPVVLDPTALNLPGFKVGQPTAVTIGGTKAFSIDLEPAGAQAASSVTIEGKTILVAPDRKYRVTVSRIPMDQEASTLIMIAEAPMDSFATFVTMADRVVQTITFF